MLGKRGLVLSPGEVIEHEQREVEPALGVVVVPTVLAVADGRRDLAGTIAAVALRVGGPEERVGVWDVRWSSVANASARPPPKQVSGTRKKKEKKKKKKKNAAT